MGSRSGKRATALSPLSACGAPGVEHRTRTRVLNRRGAERRTPAQAGCRARRHYHGAAGAACRKQVSRHGIRNDGVAAMGARIVPAKVFMPLARALRWSPPSPPPTLRCDDAVTNVYRHGVAQRAPRSRERAARRHQSTQPVVRRRLCCAVITHSATAMQLGAPPSAVRARKLKRGKGDVQFEINAQTIEWRRNVDLYHAGRATTCAARRAMIRTPRDDDRARAPWRAPRPIFP